MLVCLSLFPQVRAPVQYLVRSLQRELARSRIAHLLASNRILGLCSRQSHLGAGVRYNAQKRKVGAYYSTPIYAFRCKCHLCSGWFEIRTDPKVSSRSAKLYGP